MRRLIAGMLLIVLLAALTGCSSTAASQPPTVTVTPPVITVTTTPPPVTVTVTPSSVPVKTPSSTPSLKVVSLEYKITEKSDSYWYFSWKLVLQNDGDEPVNCWAYINFMDNQGFLLDKDASDDIVVKAKSQQSTSDEWMIESNVAENVVKIEPIINIRK